MFCLLKEADGKLKIDMKMISLQGLKKVLTPKELKNILGGSGYVCTVYYNDCSSEEVQCCDYNMDACLDYIYGFGNVSNIHCQ